MPPNDCRPTSARMGNSSSPTSSEGLAAAGTSRPRTTPHLAASRRPSAQNFRLRRACVFYYGLWRGHLAWRRTMRALLLERAGRCLMPPFKGPTFQGPGLSHPVPRRRNPDRWTCARSAACPGMQGLPATTGNSMLLCVVGLFWRLAPALGRLRARAHPLTRLSRRSRWAGPAQRCPLCLSSLAIVASALLLRCCFVGGCALPCLFLFLPFLPFLVSASA